MWGNWGLEMLVREEEDLKLRLDGEKLELSRNCWE